MPIQFDKLVQKVIREIGEVEGTSVQTYSEPRVEDKVRQAVRFVMRKYWWDNYMQWFQFSLDGMNGIITDSTGLTNVKDILDVRAVFIDGGNVRVTRIPEGKNPFTITGTKVIYYDSLPVTDPNYAARKLQFWPKTATDNIVIHARLVPTIQNNTVLHLNEDLLTYGAAWLILEDEDLNASAAAKNKTMFDQTFQDLMLAYGDQPIANPYGQRTQDHLTEWST